jgi:hypothetical protein
VGKLLSHFQGMLTVCFDNTGGLVEQPKNGLPCLVELINMIGWSALGC